MAAREDIVSDFDALRNALAAVHRMMLSGDSAAALANLQELERAHPASGLLWQERGFCLRPHGGEDAVEAAFRRAVELNDALPEAWRHLMDVARAAGRSADADRAARALAKLDSLPAELIEGSSRLSEGDLAGAEARIRGYLKRHGPHLDGMRLLAQVCMHRRNYEDAELLLEAVLDRNPDYHEARYELGMVFMQRRRIYPALLQARRLLPLDPTDRKTRMLYANACDGLGKFEEALRVYRQLQQEMPGDPELEFAVAGVLRNQGKPQDAIAEYRRAMRLEGCAGTGYAALANMKTYRFSDQEIAEMRRLERAEESPARRFPVCFALGKALEDRGEYEESFEQYARGNALRRAESHYNPETTERNLAMREELFTPEFLAGRRGMGCLRPDPIFIVGMPRAGSTLLEQVLASHSQVDGTLELPEIPRLVRQFRGRSSEDVGRYATVLAELTPQELQRLGEIYLEETRVYRERAPFFVDKLPG
ncbi:MAG: sulfotransferase, partial [Chloroflexota bacterium]